MRKIYIYGAGGFGREVLWLIDRINAKDEEEWVVEGFIDDNENLTGNHIRNYKVLGTSDFFNTVDEEVFVTIAIGNGKVKAKAFEKLSKYENIKFATLIDPSAIISDDVHIGEGCTICAGAIITVDISLGRNVIVNLDSTIGHDCAIDDFVTLYPSVNVSGNVRIGKCTEIGTGTNIIQGRRIGENCIIGAGSVVIKDIPDNSVAVGCPAKVIKSK